MLEVGRLMRSAEALTRVASSILSSVSVSAAAPPAQRPDARVSGAGGSNPPGAESEGLPSRAGPEPRKRRRRRKKRKEAGGMQVDEILTEVQRGAPQTGPAAAAAPPEAPRAVPTVPTLFGETEHTKTLIAGSTMVTAASGGDLCPSHSGVRVQLVSLEPSGSWCVELEDTGELISVAPGLLHMPLFVRPFNHGLERAWRNVRNAPT